eukprot:24785-Rhodomonas_salina.1
MPFPRPGNQPRVVGLAYPHRARAAPALADVERVDQVVFGGGVDRGQVSAQRNALLLRAAPCSSPADIRHEEALARSALPQPAQRSTRRARRFPLGA